MVVLLAGSAPVAARDVEAEQSDRMSEPLVTDRPDFTESTETIEVGYGQLEMGYTFTVDREGSDRVRDHTAPELLLRVGLAERLELRIGWNGYAFADQQFVTTTSAGRRVTRDDWSQGSNDLSLGIKYKFFEQSGPWPHFGIIAAVSVPSGSAGVSSGDVDPAVVFLWAYDVTDRFAVAGNVGVAYPTDAADRFVQTSASLSFAYALTERIGGYVEYFGFYPNTERSDAAHSINAGLTYLVNNDFQFDWRVGAGLNEEADDFFTGVGLAWRFQHHPDR